MLNSDIFKNLDIEEKKDYLFTIIYPLVRNKEEWRKYLEVFLFGSSDKDLIEFYEILLNPEKLNSYIHTKWEKLKKLNFEIKNLNNQLIRARIDVNESFDQEDSDKILCQI